MLLTESGSVTDVRPLQPENAFMPMLVTGCPSIVAGIIMGPVVDSGTAGLADGVFAPGQPIEALPLESEMRYDKGVSP